MKLASHPSAPARARRSTVAVAAFVVALSAGLVLPLSGAQAATAVPLGEAESFAILAGSTITNDGTTTVVGDVGLHPGPAVTGFGPGADEVILDGSLHVNDEDGVAEQAKEDLDIAYTNAAGQTPVTEIPTELGGQELTAGVYDSASDTFGITGTLTLDGEGDPDAVFIFQMGETLTTASDSSIDLIGDADLCNVYWQVGTSATLGSNSDFLGTIMADQSITLGTGANVEGRVLARVAAVTMDTNTITNEACTTPADGDDDTTNGDDDTTNGDDDTANGDDDTANGDDGATGGDDTVGDDGTAGDDTTVGGDGTTGDDDTATDDGTTGGDGTAGDDTTGQVQDVPSGAVAAGGGPAAAATSGPSLLATTVVMLLMVGGMVGIVARRRVRVR